MSRASQYDVVSAGDARALAAAVNDRLVAGWQPLGGLATHAGELLQAMVLSGKAEKRIRKDSED